MDTSTFAKKIKEKHPEYRNVDDSVLVSKVIEKYPQYRSSISDGTQQQRQERIDQGLPVSANPERVEPTLAGSIVRGAIQAPLSAVLAIPAAFAGDSGITVRSKYLGNTSDPTKNINDKVNELAAKVKSGEMTAGRALAGVAGEALLQAGNVASAIPVAEGAGAIRAGASAAETAIPAASRAQRALGLAKASAEGAGIGYGFDVSNSLANTDRTVGQSLVPGIGTAIGAVAPAAAEGAMKAGSGILKSGASAVKTIGSGAENASKAFGSAKSTVLEGGSTFFDRISAPDVSGQARVSLNPAEALKGTGQDIQVSVSGKNKMLSKLTPDEIKTMQLETAKNMDDFTKQAKLFSNDRSVQGGSPVEIVGNRVDRALEIADKKRQAVGAVMGAVEEKIAGQKVPIGNDTLAAFSDIVDHSNSPRYGITSQNAEVVQKMVSDFDRLAENGLTVGERNNFVRSWQQYLRDAKDPFGNFKENTTVNTKMEMALNRLKNETVDAISDPSYKAARKEYAKFMRLQETGDRLLGKDGLQGERIKGASTVKRAIQSNSDAGARQFLKELQRVTGYDAIKEGDLALTAMENVGDYQGLSLLNVLKEGKSGLINKALEAGQNLLVGDNASRVDKFIRK